MSFGSKSLPPPTEAERERWREIRFIGICPNCHSGGVEIHHLLSGGLRVSHLATVGLCAWCHRGVRDEGETITSMRWLRGPSLYHHKREFYERWGSDQALLDYQNDDICWPRTKIGRPQRRRPSPTARPTKRIGSMTTAAKRRGKTVGRISPFCTCKRDPSMTCIVHPLIAAPKAGARKKESRCARSTKTVPRPQGGFAP